MTIQKPGYPNVSIKLYESYDAWKENRFVELAATFTTLTLRDGLFGRNEGMLQFYDAKNMHTKMDGEQIVQISLSNANSQIVYNRVYGIKHFATSVDSKGDNIIGIDLEPLHVVEHLKFSRAFFANATETIQEMIRVIYRERTEIAPKVEGINVYVPRVAWVHDLPMYMDYTREVGMAVESETFVFAWEDMTGIHLQDYNQISEADPIKMVVGDISQIGSYVQAMDVGLAYDFIWLSKANRYDRNPMEDVTIYTHSFNDKEIKRVTREEGNNSIYVSRSGGYSDMTYRNGYEEAIRLLTMSQYDGYAQCKTVGDFSIRPGQKINFGDQKKQFKTDFYVDEVIHEISNNSSVTNIYMFTNGKPLKPIEIEKIKNEIPNLEPPSESVTPEPTGDVKGSDWNLDTLATVVTQNARGRGSTGDCALYVRKALQASQIKQFFAGGLGDANQMPTQLVRMNWVAVGQNVTDWKKGDIVVFQRTNTRLGQKYGHVAIYNGSQWVSDFIQPSVQPNLKDSLTYTLYRARYGYTKGA